jgi:pathogenesis-related protein 1
LVQFSTLETAAGVYGPTFEQAAASLGKKLTKDTFLRAIKEEEEKYRKGVEEFMRKWGEQIKQKKASTQTAQATKQAAREAGGNPVAQPASREVLKDKKAKLEIAGARLAVPVDSVRLGNGKTYTITQLQQMIDHKDARGPQTAALILNAWSAACKAKMEQVERVKGTTSKSAPPPKESKLHPDSVWEVIGLDQAGRDTILQAHNKWRDDFDAPHLVYDRRLEAFALDWARQLAQKWPAEERHRKEVTGISTHVDPFPGELGENIVANAPFQVYDAKKPTWKIDHRTPVDAWGSEKDNYDHKLKKPKPNMALRDYGHFTQMIWKATTRVGCGFVMFATRHPRCPIDIVHATWVCNYHCAGNFVDTTFSYGPDMYSQFKLNT